MSTCVNVKVKHSVLIFINQILHRTIFHFFLFKHFLAFCLKDLWQFYLNLTKANQEEKPNWRLEYIMTKAFGIKDIQPESLHELALKFEEPDSKEFQKYFTHFMVSFNDTVTCTEECKTVQVCSVHFLDHDMYSECVGKGQRLWILIPKALLL